MNTIHAIFALGGKPIKDDPAIIEGVVLNSDGSLPVKPADVGEAAWRSYLHSRDLHSTPQDHQRYHEKALEWGSRYDFNQALAREKALMERVRPEIIPRSPMTQTVCTWKQIPRSGKGFWLDFLR